MYPLDQIHSLQADYIQRMTALRDYAISAQKGHEPGCSGFCLSGLNKFLASLGLRPVSLSPPEIITEDPAQNSSVLSWPGKDTDFTGLTSEQLQQALHDLGASRDAIFAIARAHIAAAANDGDVPKDHASRALELLGLPPLVAEATFSAEITVALPPDTPEPQQTIAALLPAGSKVVDFWVTMGWV